MDVGLHIAPAVNRRERGVAFIALEEEVPTVPLAHLWRREDGRGGRATAFNRDDA